MFNSAFIKTGKSRKFRLFKINSDSPTSDMVIFP